MAVVNPKERKLDDIFAATSKMTFSKNRSAEIVGGEGKLLALIADGEIDVVKTSAAKNGKWRCNAAQVLAHVRDMRPKVKPAKYD